MNPVEELRGLDFGHLLAAVKKLGGRENFDRILRGEVEVEFREALRLLVDQTGRCISSVLDLTNRVRDENRSFTVPLLGAYNYGDIRAWYKDILPNGSNILGASQFEDLAESSKEIILSNRQIANLFCRAAFPVLFPQYSVGDLGTALQEFFLPVVEKGYKTKFPKREFRNRQDGELAGKVTSLPNLGNEKLFAAMAAGSGMMWVFSNPMQGFSPRAQQEAMVVLCKHGLGLAGAGVLSLAIGGFPGQLAGGYSTPGMDCSGDSWESPDCSLNFEADDDDLDFDCGSLARPLGGYSGALFFLGQPRK